MRKTVATIATVALVLLAVGAAPAFADHKEGHQNPPACQKGSKAPNQNKHCYPPGGEKPQDTGRPAGFVGDVPQQGAGITVGMATVAAVGALGALLIARRRWAFRAGPR
jgi:hypothetical protein